MHLTFKHYYSISYFAPSSLVALSALVPLFFYRNANSKAMSLLAP